MKYLDENIFEIYNENEANQIFKERANEYKLQYMIAKNKLSADFIKEYEKCCFHDYTILGLYPEMLKNYKYSVNLIFSYNAKKMSTE